MALVKILDVTVDSYNAMQADRHQQAMLRAQQTDQHQQAMLRAQRVVIAAMLHAYHVTVGQASF